jgi:hypothetical protein
MGEEEARMKMSLSLFAREGFVGVGSGYLGDLRISKL